MYKAALYLRISKDDEEVRQGKAFFSDSIMGQETILKGYVLSCQDIEIYDIYVDDGYSGTTFDRPGFNRMMEDINLKNVNCVIVKDLSRFGRNYIESGRLIQRIFPSKNIRFIAVNDNIDSLYDDSVKAGLMIPVKNFINDSYSRDISVKVRTNLNVKRQMGYNVSSFCVYGYKKDSVNHNKLVVDDYPAEIVKMIFYSRIYGNSCLNIAGILNSFGVLSPFNYKMLTGSRYTTSFATMKAGEWTSMAVKRIILNHIYTGDLFQLKTSKISYKMKERRIISPDKWIKAYNTHEEIISPRVFDTAEKSIKMHLRKGKDNDGKDIFSGIFSCGECGGRMYRKCRNNKENCIFFACRNCTAKSENHRISIDLQDLNHILLSVLNRYFMSVFFNKTGNDFKEKSINEVKEYIDKIDVGAFENFNQVLNREIPEIENILKCVDDDIRKKNIDEDWGEEIKQSLNEKKSLYLNAVKGNNILIKNILDKKTKLKKELDAYRSGDSYKTTEKITSLNKALIISLVDDIIIYKDNRVVIKFRCTRPEYMQDSQ
ncbi:MAG: recombinase family protein [Lachnospira sp.]